MSLSRRAAREADYAEFVADRQQHLLRIAYAVCGDWHGAEDLLQTSLVKLYLAWHRVHRDGREEAYTRQIIVRTHISDTRRPVFKRERAGLEGWDAAARGDLAYEERSALFDALQQLPEMQRKTVLLRYWLGLSIAEAAADLGIGEGTVKSHASRGLDGLRTVLDPVDAAALER
ncbi:SigE family RNA polymerase sigma factor [Nocardioides acrostichi]|uniref:SigE family RNA polymerase sigma factor n=1 Tax=Nocardioides acrostichi TaxID=2784339 RepID=A0A930YAE5_9ACTN|nr:SigE family RNA polymerase sigma factor [Nocardioides acrostichi]MBF4161318.1 SigE family RNA polymerase sigma factor [Nocardioides acrostichi]